MNRRVLLKLALLATVLPVAACASGWQTVRQASPNPFSNHHTFVVAPVTAERLLIQRVPEAQWVANRTPEQQSGWQRDRAAMTGRFVDQFNRRGLSGEAFAALVDVVPPDSFVLALDVSEFSERVMSATLTIRDAAGRVLDEVFFSVPTTGGMGAGVSMWLGNGIGRLSREILSYLRTRTG